MIWLLSFIAIIVGKGASDVRRGKRTTAGRAFSAKGRRSK